MTDFGNNELRRLDLTLLLIILGVVRSRKASTVALQLGLTQSGVSQGLKRLRDIFYDDLFLRRPHGMEPTEVALALEPRIAAAVEHLRGALVGARPFDPARAEGVTRLAALDAVQAEIVPGLMRRICHAAPGLQLSVLPLTRRAAMEALNAGEADLAIGFFWDFGDSLISHPLYRQGFTVVGQPSAIGAQPMGLARYAALPHVLVSPGGELRGVADQALAAQGLSRRVVASVPHFFPALATVAKTACIATLPDRLAARYAPMMGLQQVPPPLERRSFTVAALRHRRNAQDARLLWLLGLLAQDQSSPAISARNVSIPSPVSDEVSTSSG